MRSIAGLNAAATDTDADPVHGEDFPIEGRRVSTGFKYSDPSIRAAPCPAVVFESCDGMTGQGHTRLSQWFQVVSETAREIRIRDG